MVVVKKVEGCSELALREGHMIAVKKAEGCSEWALREGHMVVVKKAEGCSELALKKGHMAAVKEAGGCSEVAASEARKKSLDWPHYLVIQQLQSRAGSEWEFHTHMDLLAEEEGEKHVVDPPEAEAENAVLLQLH